MGYGDYSGQDWARIVPLVAAGVVIGLFAGFKVASLKPVVNLNRKQQPDSDKVVHQVFVEDLGDKKAFCRCWRSNNFPYCDGSHTQHNKDTGDNVGPLVISKKS